MSAEKKDAPSLSTAPKPSAESNRLVVIKDAVGIVQSVVTILGILAAGIWFYVHREHLPKANIAHKVTHRQLTEAITWVHLSVSITNVGKRLLDITSGVIRIQQILPLDPQIADKLKERQDPISPKDFTVPWPKNYTHRPHLLLQIEPGETDIKEYEFLIPAFVKTVKVYTYFERLKEPPIGWLKTTIYDLKKKGDKGHETQDFMGGFSGGLVTGLASFRVCNFGTN